MDSLCALLGMTCSGLAFTIGLEVILLPIGILLALAYDNIGKPRLLIRAADPADFPNSREGHVRHLYLEAINQPRHGLLVRRKTAMNCHGTISLYTREGKPVFEQMPLRWAGNPEPLMYTLDATGKIVTLPDNRLMRESRYMSIPPDAGERFDVAMRVQGESTAYGFTDSSYLKNRRDPAYEIPAGEFIVRVDLRSDDERFAVPDFVLINTGGMDDFSLRAIDYRRDS